MAYEVEIRSAAQRQMLSLPKEVQVEVALSIDRLGNIPRPPRVKKLAESGLWRIRVGQYRIVYVIEDKAQLVTIIRVA
ncbi:MAG: type II toxin-antitoxin system RelE/ParE family toxin, partial [Dehalococcoidia bacterium]|nr:type II toxin-antitoxin system RelE/ParE family toxin [Dehalococcoidia bacterium]